MTELILQGVASCPMSDSFELLKRQRHGKCDQNTNYESQVSSTLVAYVFKMGEAEYLLLITFIDQQRPR